MTVGPQVMLSVDRVIPAPTDAVWGVLVNPETWPQWGPTMSRVVLDGNESAIGLGSTGQLYTPLGVAFPFVITEFEPGRYWAWTVAGIPATRHRVDALDDGSRVTFEVPWWGAAYLPICAIALRRIEGLVTG